MSETPEACFAFVFPEDARRAVKDAIEFLKTDCTNSATDGGKPWEHGIFSCLNNPALCLATCLCPVWGVCIQYRNEERMTGKSCEVAFVNSVVAQALCLGVCHAAVVRRNFRRKYGLEGSPCTDWLFVCCLGPCALCSHANTLMALEGYQVPFLQLPGASAGAGAGHGSGGASKVQVQPTVK